MIRFAFSKMKEKKYIIQGIIFMSIFLTLYFILDYLNYREAVVKPSTLWIIGNSILNIIMASLSTLLMNLSTVMVEIKAAGDKASNLGFISIIFGIFTYGCTSCVISFFIAIGAVGTASFLQGLPGLAIGYGILYKLLSLLLIGIGLGVVLHNLEKGTCKVKLD